MKRFKGSKEDRGLKIKIMKIYKVKESDLIGGIKDFPIEVVQKMVERQHKQHGKCDISAFQGYIWSSWGFTWKSSTEGYEFWESVIIHRNFDLFFDRYPKQDLPLPRMVLVWDEDEDNAQERELIHVFPKSFGLDFRYVVRSLHSSSYISVYRYMKELPAPKKMTKAEIEKELGYKIEIV